MDFKKRKIGYTKEQSRKMMIASMAADEVLEVMDTDLFKALKEMQPYEKAKAMVAFTNEVFANYINKGLADFSDASLSGLMGSQPFDELKEGIEDSDVVMILCAYIAMSIYFEFEVYPTDEFEVLTSCVSDDIRDYIEDYSEDINKKISRDANSDEIAYGIISKNDPEYKEYFENECNGNLSVIDYETYDIVGTEQLQKMLYSLVYSKQEEFAKLLKDVATSENIDEVGSIASCIMIHWIAGIKFKSTRNRYIEDSEYSKLYYSMETDIHRLIKAAHDYIKAKSKTV